MKCFLIYQAFTFLITFSNTHHTKTANNELIINGTINNIQESIPCIYILVLRMNDDGFDSVKVINNKYTYHTNITGATLVTLYAKNPNNPDAVQGKNSIPLFLEPTEVNILSTGSFSNAKVSGSEAFKEYCELKSRFLNPYTHKAMCMRPDPAIYFNYFKTHTSSPIAPYVLCNYAYSVSSKEMKNLIIPLFNKLPVDDRDSYFGKRLKRLIDKAQ